MYANASDDKTFRTPVLLATVTTTQTGAPREEIRGVIQDDPICHIHLLDLDIIPSQIRRSDMIFSLKRQGTTCRLAEDTNIRSLGQGACLQ